MPDSGPDAGPILVTGIAGQLASALAERASVRRVGRPAFDFDRPDTIETCFRASRPRLVINAAAYTAVDAAEADPEAAYRGNCEGPAALADLCAAFAVPFIHVSTDYVFDGRSWPYAETDLPSPQCVYGASKLAGERAVLARCAGAVIVRTSWVYAPSGKNFVLTMLKAARKADRLERIVGELEDHMQKEEQILFPLMRRGGHPIISQPIFVMTAEHDEHGANLRELERLTAGFEAPEDACPTWRALCAGAQKFAEDLTDHIHIENNVLFPRFSG